MKIIDRDPWLKPFEAAITGRHQNAINKETELVGRGTLKDFAAGHQYFGLHQTATGKWAALQDVSTVAGRPRRANPGMYSTSGTGRPDEDFQRPGLGSGKAIQIPPSKL